MGRRKVDPKTRPIRKAYPEFKGTDEKYIELAKIMDQYGGYSGRLLIKAFGRKTEEGTGYYLLPRKITSKKGPDRWVLDRRKDYQKVMNEQRKAAEEIPIQVQEDIRRIYGQEELNNFTKWVTDGVGQKHLSTRLMELFTGKKYDVGHWKAIQAAVQGEVPAWQWDWLGRSPHVGLNLDPEVASQNRKKGNQADPSEQFLVNAGIPRNWMEAFIYYKDSSGLPSKKESGLSSRQLGIIGEQTTDQPRLEGEGLELAIYRNSTLANKPTTVINNPLKTLQISTLGEVPQNLLDKDYNTAVSNTLTGAAGILPPGMSSTVYTGVDLIKEGERRGIEPFNLIPGALGQTKEQRLHQVSLDQYRAALAASQAELQSHLLTEAQKLEIKLAKERGSQWSIFGIDLPELGFTERVNQLTGGGAQDIQEVLEDRRLLAQISPKDSQKLQQYREYSAGGGDKAVSGGMTRKQVIELGQGNLRVKNRGIQQRADKSGMSFEDQRVYEAGGGEKKQRDNRLSMQRVMEIGQSNLNVQDEQLRLNYLF